MMSHVHIHAPPTVSGYTRRVENKWCFGCCKHGEHREVIVLDCSGWYGPTGWWRCPLCLNDCTEFGAGQVYSSRSTREIMPLEVALKVQMEAVKENIEHDQRTASAVG